MVLKYIKTLKCSKLSLVLTCGFLATMLLPLFVNPQRSKNSLKTPEQEQIYQQIVKERREIYAKGLILGLTLALFAKDPCNFVIITMGTVFLFYTISPKTTYMLEHLEPDQVGQWVKDYRHMQLTWYSLFAIAVIISALVLKKQ